MCLEPSVLVPAFKAGHLLTADGMAEAYQASANGYYVYSNNVMHNIFLQKVVNKDYIGPSPNDTFKDMIRKNRH